MQNLISSILIKMAKVDAQSKDLAAQVDAQSLLMAAMCLTLQKGEHDSLSTNILKAITAATLASKEILRSDADLLLMHINRLVSITHFVEVHVEPLAETTPSLEGDRAGD
ncbi:anti-adapter protein IraP [Sodalis sp. RH15]|uniref:anti-adapter protein IraP n=1 Tax=Sodalis sp. RH15 TaxID=3394330 RepID=UPI0039B6037E